MNGVRRFRLNAEWIILSCFWLTQAPVLAQQGEPARPRAVPRPTLDALPGESDGRTPANAVAPPPVTPPTILAVEAQPIDLTTALELANVQNPEFNVARTRILEAAAMRQLAAAYFLPSINPGLNYDSHTGNLQQSDGNILSLNRSAVYVGAGANAVGSGTVNIPGVYYNINAGAGIFAYLASRQTVREREFASIAVRNQVFLRVTRGLQRAAPSRGETGSTDPRLETRRKWSRGSRLISARRG